MHNIIPITKTLVPIFKFELCSPIKIVFLSVQLNNPMKQGIFLQSTDISPVGYILTIKNQILLTIRLAAKTILEKESEQI